MYACLVIDCLDSSQGRVGILTIVQRSSSSSRTQTMESNFKSNLNIGVQNSIEFKLSLIEHREI